MTPRDPAQPSTRSFKTTLAILAVALAGVALLFALGRSHWFELRPASGVAAAMGHAATADTSSAVMTTTAPAAPHR